MNDSPSAKGAAHDTKRSAGARDDARRLLERRLSGPRLRMTKKAHGDLLHTVGARPAESGGILLGPRDTDLVTQFVFDDRGTCTGGTYAPDHESLNRRLRSEWWPAGLTMCGFAHAHPDGVEHLSGPDLFFIRRILECNPSMEVFVAPIVIPTRFWLRPFVVVRTPFAVELRPIEIVDVD